MIGKRSKTGSRFGLKIFGPMFPPFIGWLSRDVLFLGTISKNEGLKDPHNDPYVINWRKHETNSSTSTFSCPCSRIEE